MKKQLKEESEAEDNLCGGLLQFSVALQDDQN